MIDKALDVLKNGIRDYLVQLPDLNITSQEIIHLDHIVEADGSLALPGDSLGLSLVNIEEERITKAQQNFSRSADGNIVHMNPEIKLNLFVLIVANFSNYRTGLEFLSGAIRFFQSKNVFTTANTPELDPQIQKLIVEMMTLSFEQQNHMWGSLGAKYLPSVMYKVRMLTIQEGLAADEQKPITMVNLTGRNV
ncbi:MAG: DUF4255 domain-containing protein [Desulfobacterales bacterium]|jgi:hypothetical protein